MPFEPIKKDKWKKYNDNTWISEPCRDLEHDPPSMMVFYESGWWSCPTCGAKVFIQGSNDRYHWDNGKWNDNNMICSNDLKRF